MAYLYCTMKQTNSIRIKQTNQTKSTQHTEKMGQLHLHTPFSDGAITLENILDANYEFVAISDHDDTSAFATYKNLEKVGIEVIPAVEISCFFYGKKLHILSYWPNTNNRTFQNALAAFRHRRRVRTTDQINRLRAEGFDISENDFKKYGIIVKKFIANEVVNKQSNKKRLEKENIHTANQFIKNYLSFGKPTYVSLKRTPAEEVLPYAGGVLVLAHPGRNITPGKDDFIVEQLAYQLNIQGIETGSRRHTPEVKEHYDNLADKLGLVKTTSNDVHMVEQIPYNLEPYAKVEELKDRLNYVNKRVENKDEMVANY